MTAQTLTPAVHVKVMIVIGSLAVGGAQKHVYDLLGQLDRTRFDLSVAVLTGGGHFFDRVRALGIPVHVLGVKTRRDLILRFPAFAGLVRRVKPDVLHLFLYETSMFGCLLRLVRGRRGPRVILSKRSLELDLRVDREIGYRTVLMRVPDAITAVSEAVARRCHELGASPAKVRVIENGIRQVDTLDRGKLRRLLGLGPGTPLVGAVGSLTTRKGHRHLLAAAPHVLAACPDTHFVLLGEGGLRKSLEADAARLGIQDRVHLPGALFPALSYIADLDLFVLPSSEEGMSNALLEAMMAGLPCITNDIPSNHEVLTQGVDGVLVNVEDPRSFADEIVRLLDDRVLRTALGARAQQTIGRRFDPRTMIEANESLYVALAGTRMRGAATA
jgi:glycosyltransferase involved in cell wall biosynthesis